MATTLWAPNDPVKAKEYFEQKMAFTTGPAELKKAMEENQPIVVVDVRRKEDFDKGHIPGAINLPIEKWESAEGLSKDKLNVVYCYSQTCHLAASAAVKFAEKGFPVRELEGGMKAWQRYGFKVEKSEGVTDEPPKKYPEPPKVDEFTTARMSSHH